MDEFSIIVPVYNVASYLPAALDSLLAQTMRGWTAICVDDGSDDGSGAILDAYAARDGRIQVVHQANAGVSAARNVALDRAKGTIVAFMDPDDVVSSDWLARMCEALQDADAVLCGYAENGRSVVPRDVGCRYGNEDVRMRCWRAFFGYRLRDCLFAPLPGGMWRWCGREMAGVWRCAVRREIVGDLRFDVGLRLYEDAMFLSRLSQRIGRLVIAGDCGYHWQVRPRGAMTREFRDHLVANKFAVRDVRRAIDPKMTHWRGTFLLSALEILRATRSLRLTLRYAMMSKGNHPRESFRLYIRQCP